MFTGNEGLDKGLILLRDRYFIFLHQGIEHHLRAYLMCPSSALPNKI